MKVEGWAQGDKFTRIKEFCHELKEAGAGNKNRPGEITRLEFLCFLLVKNGVLELENIRNAMNNFKKLDVGKNGVLTLEDVEAWDQRFGSAMDGLRDGEDDSSQQAVSAAG